jgi:5-methylcytosine-specific restriction endonuclease McrA
VLNSLLKRRAKARPYGDFGPRNSLCPKIPIQDLNMKNKKPNAALVWKQMEDLLAPQLNFSLADRAVYSHLFRHSRLVGKLQFRFSISRLARGVGLSPKCTRDTVRRLIARGVLYLVERNYRAHHVVRVRLPLEVKGVCGAKTAAHRLAPAPRVVINIEEADFLEKQNLRRAIHERERGHCFYCLRRITPKRRCLDHVVPRAEFGLNSYRNLVSCCVDCNSQKGERSAVEHVRWLYRERRLSDAELSGRLRALDELAAGKLKPPVPGQG